MFIIANFGKKTTILESEQFKFSLRERKERISRTHFMFSVPKREILRTKHCSQRSKKRPERGESSASVIRTLFVEARQEEGGAYVANNLPSWLALLFLSLIIMMRSTQGLFFSSFSSSQHLFCLCVRFLPFLSKSRESPVLVRHFLIQVSISLRVRFQQFQLEDFIFCSWAHLTFSTERFYISVRGHIRSGVLFMRLWTTPFGKYSSLYWEAVKSMTEMKTMMIDNRDDFD